MFKVCFSSSLSLILNAKKVVCFRSFSKNFNNRSAVLKVAVVNFCFLYLISKVSKNYRAFKSLRSKLLSFKNLSYITLQINI